MRRLRNRRKPTILIVLFVLALAAIDRFANPIHVPWKPLDPDAPIGLATGSKITMIALGPSRKCLSKLADADLLEFTQAPPKNGPDVCGWKIAATMTEAGGVTFRPRQVTSQCSVTLAGYIWLRHVDEAARKRLGSGLKKVHHAGTYSCRRQRGNSSGAWSEHAYGNAWDITGFELLDGRVISVLKDWDKGTTKESKARTKFLRDARGSACRLFRVVLTPNYNDAHKDHFHLDQGPSLSCR